MIDAFAFNTKCHQDQHVSIETTADLVLAPETAETDAHTPSSAGSGPGSGTGTASTSDSGSGTTVKTDQTDAIDDAFFNVPHLDRRPRPSRARHSGLFLAAIDGRHALLIAAFTLTVAAAASSGTSAKESTAWISRQWAVDPIYLMYRRVQ